MRARSAPSCCRTRRADASVRPEPGRRAALRPEAAATGRSEPHGCTSSSLRRAVRARARAPFARDGVADLALEIGRRLGARPRRARRARLASRSCTTSARSRSRTRSSTSPARSTSGSGCSSASTPSSASGSSARRRPLRTSRTIVRSSARALGRHAATRTGSPARRSRWRRGSSPPATPSWRWPRSARTGAALPIEAALEELQAIAGTQFDPDGRAILVAHVREQLEAARGLRSPRTLTRRRRATVRTRLTACQATRHRTAPAATRQAASGDVPAEGGI